MDKEWKTITTTKNNNNGKGGDMKHRHAARKQTWNIGLQHGSRPDPQTINETWNSEMEANQGGMEINETRELQNETGNGLQTETGHAMEMEHGSEMGMDSVSGKWNENGMGMEVESQREQKGN